MSDYFVGNDAHGDPWVWRENGDRPIQALNLLHVAPEHAPLLDLIRAAVEGEVRKERAIKRADGSTVAHFLTAQGTPVRRTVITGAWEEER